MSEVFKYSRTINRLRKETRNEKRFCQKVIFICVRIKSKASTLKAQIRIKTGLLSL